MIRELINPTYSPSSLRSSGPHIDYPQFCVWFFPLVSFFTIRAALSPCLHFQNNFTFGSNFWKLPKSTSQIYSNFKNKNPAEYSAPLGLSASTVPLYGCLWLPVPPHTHCAFISQEMEACFRHGLEIELCCFCEGMWTHY